MGVTGELKVTDDALGDSKPRSHAVPLSQSERALLEPGLHVVSRTQLRSRFVDPFPQSTSRVDLTTRLMAFFDLIDSIGVAGEIWLDGSYTTSKLDPNDVDIVVFIVRTDIDKLADDQYNRLMQLKDRPLMSARYNCDVYVDPLGDIDRTQYWRSKFGTDSRTQVSKGIAVIKFDGSAR